MVVEHGESTIPSARSPTAEYGDNNYKISAPSCEEPSNQGVTRLNEDDIMRDHNTEEGVMLNNGKCGGLMYK